MFEPATAVAWADAIASAAGDSPKRFRVARRMSPNELLLKRPARLDRVEIGRVRRHVDETHLVGRARSCDARVMVRGEVVHDEHVVRAELGEKNGLEPSNES